LKDDALILTLESEIMTPTTCLRWKPTMTGMKTKNILLTGNADGTLSHWHVSSGKLLHRLKESDN